MHDDDAPAAAERPVVTIFELYGAGATEVGTRVAEALGLPFHAQAFSSAALEGDTDSAADSAADSATDEAATLATVLGVMGGAYGGLGGPDIVATQRATYDLVMSNNRQVWEYAAEGGVIVGRNGAVVLEGRPNTVHVLLVGPVADRVARAAETEGISLEKAAERQKREDTVRAEMSQALYGWDPRLPERYDLVVNTGRIPLDAAADAIVQAVRVRVP